ncbi:MAG: hypothetical protein KF889_28855 [Alphaproteobacteria bacterium]|nr:hypothetical protein [Alphaproteobacteria bacterium]MCW5742982.1 hypothetical protein [Alphaproteobacteria bacterium]
MSALSHLIEQRGIATVALGIIRLHMEKVRVPRGLWVPFELGRPLGEPQDAAFQRRVVLAALSLLERDDGPVILEDYAEEAPGRLPQQGWRPAVELPAVPRPAADASAAEWAAALRAEWAPLTMRARTTIGGSRLERERWPELLAAFASRTPPRESPVAGLRPVQAARYAADDLKALYTEAAVAPDDRPSSAQVLDWFWNSTVAAALLRRIRAACLASDDRVLALVGPQFVPAARV